MGAKTENDEMDMEQNQQPYLQEKGNTGLC